MLFSILKEGHGNQIITNMDLDNIKAINLLCNPNGREYCFEKERLQFLTWSVQQQYGQVRPLLL